MGEPARTEARSPGPHIDPETGAATFVVAAVPGLRPQRVWFHLREFGADPVFRREGRLWVATLPRPPVDRLEYLLVVRDTGGHEAMVLDPANDDLVPGPFGDHSVLRWPGYREPAWLGHPPGRWTTEPVDVDTGVPVLAQLRTPEGTQPDDVLPLLVVHDGPEYVRLCRLLDHLDALADDAPRTRCRVLLLAPVSRNADYSANPAYGDALVSRVIPSVTGPGSGPIVGVGASLGALALLHAAVRRPGTFDGLFLQSGSFFLPQYDAHEKRFEFFDRVVEFVAGFDSEPRRLAGLRVALTAGLGEENLENNRALAARLQAHGVPTTLDVGRDGHNHVAWRDLLAPSLGDLLLRR